MSLESKLNNNWSQKYKTKVLSIQGPSTAGKTYLSKKIESFLVNLNKKVMVISMDDYYLPRSADALVYDFDNPGALNWKALTDLLTSIDQKEEHLKIYKYSFEGSKSIGPLIIKNTFPEYLIIDGIYSLYLFSPIFFDLQKYDPTQQTDALFVKNPFTFNNLAPLNILLTTCKQKMFNIRMQRDFMERGKSKEMIEFQLNNQVWPATKKWVLNPKLKVDQLFWHGTFNDLQLDSFFMTLSTFITKKFAKHEIKEKPFFCRDCGMTEQEMHFHIKANK